MIEASGLSGTSSSSADGGDGDDVLVGGDGARRPPRRRRRRCADRRTAGWTSSTAAPATTSSSSRRAASMLPPGAPQHAGAPRQLSVQPAHHASIRASGEKSWHTPNRQIRGTIPSPPRSPARAPPSPASALYSGAINVLTLTGSLFMLQVYDRVLPSRSTQTLVALLVIVAFLFGIQAVLEAIRTRMLTRVSRRLDEDLSGPAFRSAVSPAAVAANGGARRPHPRPRPDQAVLCHARPGRSFRSALDAALPADLLPVPSLARLADRGRRADRFGAGDLGRAAQPRLVEAEAPRWRRSARASSTARGATPKCWRR